MSAMSRGNVNGMIDAVMKWTAHQSQPIHQYLELIRVNDVLQRQRIAELESLCDDSHSAMDEHMEIHAQAVNRVKELEAQVKELEIDGETYRQDAMEAVRKACQDTGILVDAEDSVSISKVSDIVAKVRQLQAEVARQYDELESHAWKTSPATAQAQIEQQAVKIEELHNQVARWKQEAQWAAEKVLDAAGWIENREITPTDQHRARRILDGVL